MTLPKVCEDISSDVEHEFKSHKPGLGLSSVAEGTKLKTYKSSGGVDCVLLEDLSGRNSQL